MTGYCCCGSCKAWGLAWASGQTENVIFINKMKDQLLPEKACGLALPPYPTLLTVPALVSLLLDISMHTESKSDQPSVHYTTLWCSCAINRSDDPWSLLFSEVEKRSESTTASSAQTFPI